ncbi:MAG: hypothetical protein EOO12_03885 [Chitinophagaceae bacterium]|nr:MAG: hypothetical protein EOO12_03885 [Chitinophagaceae bacterium]
MPFRLRILPAQAIVLLAVLQVFCVTYLLQVPHFAGPVSLLFFGSGLAIAWLILEVPAARFDKGNFFSRQSIVKGLVLLALLPLSRYVARTILDGTPVSIEHADMLPILKVQATRFLHGQWDQIHAPVPEIWNGMVPIYLPALWMPYCYPIAMDFDMRWLTVAAIWLCVALCVLPGRWRRPLPWVLLSLGLLFLLCWFHFEGTNNVIRLTEEGIIYAYYALLAAALLSGNPWLAGIATALCFLSRYALIGWLPFALVYLLYKKEYGYLWRFAAAGAATGLLLLAPVGLQPLKIHASQPGLYIAHAERVWRENPEYFWRSVGLSKFFGPGGVRANHSTLLYGTFLAPILFFFLVRKKTVPLPQALLAGLQVGLTIFYNFMDVSYLYLFYTPVFVSLVAGAWLLAGSEREIADA